MNMNNNQRTYRGHMSGTLLGSKGTNNNNNNNNNNTVSGLIGSILDLNSQDTLEKLEAIKSCVTECRAIIEYILDKQKLRIPQSRAQLLSLAKEYIVKNQHTWLNVSLVNASSSSASLSASATVTTAAPSNMGTASGRNSILLTSASVTNVPSLSTTPSVASVFHYNMGLQPSSSTSSSLAAARSMSPFSSSSVVSSTTTDSPSPTSSSSFLRSSSSARRSRRPRISSTMTTTTHTADSSSIDPSEVTHADPSAYDSERLDDTTPTSSSYRTLHSGVRTDSAERRRPRALQLPSARQSVGPLATTRETELSSSSLLSSVSPPSSSRTMLSSSRRFTNASQSPSSHLQVPPRRRRS
eukprot:TRINITY_DN3144_c0_g1_i1.p1 TRINITY_DN3144_c0_g1~~TRINITY_DN3144_c0_g1_i1.p1  ORF type:complete len:393 (+),score=116.91 TRINITY_DN3144_c0_g1_i1:117-1181(+)